MGASSSEESPRDQYDYMHPNHYHQHHAHHLHDTRDSLFSRAFTNSFLHRRRLSFEPDKKLFFPYEPGKQATSAVRIKNVCRSNIAFKFLTTAPKSCFMRPPCGVLLPGESIVATVVKRIHRPQRARTKQTKDKFKIISLKMIAGVEFTPELFDEQRDRVVVEQVLRVHFLDPDDPTSELEKLKLRIAEADAANEACRKSVENVPTRIIGPGNVLEEWNKMKLARQMGKEDLK
ncbi:hypothetical protein GOP47_0008588 [Adiantum capillus-veneris]|uniref:MSP domain-containing protein n=1 Tax=Adiantum capillus-veneris TaxID=13818 RepID=A0A9D4ZI72_ADICA|nr:hypothetical protein GOP47_0008588 [Adiantum capillus-veneris]